MNAKPPPQQPSQQSSAGDHGPGHLPGRERAGGDAELRHLVEDLAPGDRPVDLRGTFSRNLHLPGAGLVLRVHPPTDSLRRVTAERALRRRLLDAGVRTARPVAWHGREAVRVGGRWAELEEYMPHRSQPPGDAWLFGALGRLHRVLASLDLTVPRPAVATYGPPRSLRRWLAVTGPAVAHHPEATRTVARVRRLVARLDTRWVPATALPVHPVHGDAKTGNIVADAQGAAVYLDFGFAAVRPRVHDLAYALAWRLLPTADAGPEDDLLARALTAYEQAASPLSALERTALVPYAAAVPLYYAAVAGYTADPVAELTTGLRVPFLTLAERLLSPSPPLLR
ncbi:phosphotransferase enzyme family protein [Streptomyces sp. NPDC020917]|uniref:phosphotransferase enzyme family protein n=1 Tax=Streptomyces sp. NPDC020917 TaxID=3365102 RepID=UPI00379CA864